MGEHDAEYYEALIESLDAGPWTVTKREAHVLECVLAQGGWLSRRQKAVLDDMAKKYGLEDR